MTRKLASVQVVTDTVPISLFNMMSVCEKLGLAKVSVEEMGDKLAYDTVE